MKGPQLRSLLVVGTTTFPLSRVRAKVVFFPLKRLASSFPGRQRIEAMLPKA